MSWSRRLAVAIFLLGAAAAQAQYPVAPTAPPGDNSSKIANTAWVQANSGRGPSPVNAKCDIYVAVDGSMTAGSSLLTSAAYTFPAAAVGKNVVVMGAGAGPFWPTTIAAYTVNSGGTGHATNDNVTMSDGTVLRVITQTGGVVQPGGLAVWSSAGKSTLPSQPLIQTGTTGSGTGLQVTLVFYGSPLYSTITGVSGNVATLAAAAVNAVSKQTWWYGTDDGAAIQAALNGASGYTQLPGNCGTARQIEMPSLALNNTLGSTAWLYGVGREVSGLYALAPMTAVVHHDTTESFGGGIADLTIEAGGLAQYGIYQQAGHYFTIMHTSVRDTSGAAASSDIQIGDGSTLVEETFILDDLSENNFNAQAPGQVSLRNIQYANNANDGWIIGTTLSAAQNQNIQLIGGADHIATLHTFGHAPDYAPSQAIILGATGDSADGVQIDGATGGSGLSLGAQGTTALNILCNGFHNDGTPPCVNDAAGIPTNVTVDGVTPVAGQTAITVGGSAVPNLVAIRYGSYVYDPNSGPFGIGGVAAFNATGNGSAGANGNSSILFTPPFGGSGAATQTVGVFVAPQFTSLTGTSNFWAAYNMAWGNNSTPVPAGSKGQLGGYECNITSAQTSADQIDFSHCFGGTLVAKSTGQLDGISLGVTWAGGNGHGINIFPINTVSGGSQYGVWVESDGSTAHPIIANYYSLNGGGARLDFGSEPPAGGGLGESDAFAGFAGFGDSTETNPYVIIGQTNTSNGTVRTASNHALFLGTNNATTMELSTGGNTYMLGGLAIGAFPPATVSAGEFGATKIAASGVAPGAGFAKMEWVAGTAGGSCKLIAYAGTSATPVTIVDNVGTGC